jgi:hypothetical protein
MRQYTGVIEEDAAILAAAGITVKYGVDVISVSPVRVVWYV